ncbi:MAG: BadF/BadG/BcrA/BcrD ATPase family protein [Massilia sp.]
MTELRPLCLGIDAGGSRTRWALAAADGAPLAEGEVAGLSALQAHTDAGRDVAQATLAELATAVLGHGRPVAVHAGLSGFGGAEAVGEQWRRWLSTLLDLPAGAVVLSNDIEIAYRASFRAGEGYLVYAGTGSIGAWIDGDGSFRRAGGRGVLLDDGGGGYWIAREALRHIWRAEDEQPGAWQASPMARAVFAQIGGSDWDRSRQFMHVSERGQVGMLALAVAETCAQDPAAADILHRAGAELARLALALVQRFGARPVALAGRASQLHPMILAAMRAALPPTISLTHQTIEAHHAAARLAAVRL